MKKIVVPSCGGPEALRLVDVPMPEPGPKDALVRIATSGVNFIDTYFRTGLYKAPEQPVAIGSEAAGIVERVGAEVTDLQAGRSRGLRDGPRLLRRVRGRAGRDAGEDSRRRGGRRRRGGHAPGDDSALPDPFRLPARQDAHVSRARGRRRHGRHARAGGQDARRACHRHRVDRGQGEGCARAWRRRDDSSTPSRTSPRRSSVSPMGAASTSSTTRSGRRRSARA